MGAQRRTHRHEVRDGGSKYTSLQSLLLVATQVAIQCIICNLRDPQAHHRDAPPTPCGVATPPPPPCTTTLLDAEHTQHTPTHTHTYLDNLHLVWLDELPQGLLGLQAERAVGFTAMMVCRGTSSEEARAQGSCTCGEYDGGRRSRERERVHAV